MNLHYKKIIVYVNVTSTNMLYALCNKVKIQVLERHLSKIHLFRNCRQDKFMTTTLRSVANLGEGNSVTKPCEAGLRTDTSGVSLQKYPNRAGSCTMKLVEK